MPKFILACLLAVMTCLGTLPAHASISPDKLPLFPTLPHKWQRFTYHPPLIAAPHVPRSKGEVQSQECQQVDQAFITLKGMLKHDNPNAPVTPFLDAMDDPWQLLVFNMISSAPKNLPTQAPAPLLPMMAPYLGFLAVKEMNIQAPTTQIYLVILLADAANKCHGTRIIPR